jgi:hypothetical protein
MESEIINVKTNSITPNQNRSKPVLNAQLLEGKPMLLVSLTKVMEKISTISNPSLREVPTTNPTNALCRLVQIAPSPETKTEV